ncbi:hypothetical protein [Muricomes intestini]|uniref:hypothetical protein n=1 Tax=Muricomes intestini TaxID=1796634 RepID=UPI002FDD9EB3
MTFPKQLMTIPELIKMGFTRRELENRYHEKGQDYAWRRNSKSSVRGHIVFDTELFGQEIEAEKEMQSRVRERRIS